MSDLTPSCFNRPETFLSGIDARGAAGLLSAASDVAIAVDSEGNVSDIAFGAPDLAIEGMDDWRGKPVTEIVTVESVPKIRELLGGDEPSGIRWRQVNHPTPSGEDVPVRYRAVPAPSGDGSILIGRDLRSIATLQSRLIGAQQTFERDYARLRHMETRYQLLFRTAADGLLVVNCDTRRIVESNERAAELFVRSEPDLARRRFPVGLDAPSSEAAEEMLERLRSTGRGDRITVASEDGEREFELDATLFRSDDAPLALIHIRPTSGGVAMGSETDRRIVALVRSAAEGVVLTDERGLVIWANESFLDMVQAAVAEQVRGESLDRYFARPGVDLGVMLSNAREHGQLRFFATTLAGPYGATTEVDVSTIALRDGQQAGFGFIFRNSAFGQSRSAAPGTAGGLPRSVDQLKSLIGRMPLKEIVRETTDVIERLCIETALGMTKDNRASAADLLGLSRQSLYVKLRRHGIGEHDINEPS